MASIVNYLNSIGIDSSFANRKKLALENGISNYKGTAELNISLYNKLKNKNNSNSDNTFVVGQLSANELFEKLKARGGLTDADFNAPNALKLINILSKDLIRELTDLGDITLRNQELISNKNYKQYALDNFNTYLPTYVLGNTELDRKVDANRYKFYEQYGKYLSPEQQQLMAYKLGLLEETPEIAQHYALQGLHNLLYNFARAASLGLFSKSGTSKKDWADPSKEVDQSRFDLSTATTWLNKTFPKWQLQVETLGVTPEEFLKQLQYTYKDYIEHGDDLHMLGQKNAKNQRAVYDYNSAAFKQSVRNAMDTAASRGAAYALNQFAMPLDLVHRAVKSAVDGKNYFDGNDIVDRMFGLKGGPVKPFGSKENLGYTDLGTVGNFVGNMALDPLTWMTGGAGGWYHVGKTPLSLTNGAVNVPYAVGIGVPSISWKSNSYDPVPFKKFNPEYLAGFEPNISYVKTLLENPCAVEAFNLARKNGAKPGDIITGPCGDKFVYNFDPNYKASNKIILVDQYSLPYSGVGGFNGNINAYKVDNYTTIPSNIQSLKVPTDYTSVLSNPIVFTDTEVPTYLVGLKQVPGKKNGGKLNYFKLF